MIIRHVDWILYCFIASCCQWSKSHSCNEMTMHGYVPQWSFWVSCISFWYPTTRSLKLDQKLLFYSKYDGCRSYLFISKECCCCCLSWCIQFILFAHDERWHQYTLLEALVHIRQLSSTHLLLGDTWLSYTAKDYMICSLRRCFRQRQYTTKDLHQPLSNPNCSKWDTFQVKTATTFVLL